MERNRRNWKETSGAEDCADGEEANDVQDGRRGKNRKRERLEYLIWRIEKDLAERKIFIERLISKVDAKKYPTQRDWLRKQTRLWQEEWEEEQEKQLLKAYLGPHVLRSSPDDGCPYRPLEIERLRKLARPIPDPPTQPKNRVAVVKLGMSLSEKEKWWGAAKPRTDKEEPSGAPVEPGPSPPQEESLTHESTEIIDDPQVTCEDSAEPGGVTRLRAQVKGSKEENEEERKGGGGEKEKKTVHLTDPKIIIMEETQKEERELKQDFSYYHTFVRPVLPKQMTKMKLASNIHDFKIKGMASMDAVRMHGLETLGLTEELHRILLVLTFKEPDLKNEYNFSSIIQEYVDRINTNLYGERISGVFFHYNEIGFMVIEGGQIMLINYLRSLRDRKQPGSSRWRVDQEAAEKEEEVNRDKLTWEYTKFTQLDYHNYRHHLYPSTLYRTRGQREKKEGDEEEIPSDTCSLELQAARVFNVHQHCGRRLFRRWFTATAEPPWSKYTSIPASEKDLYSDTYKMIFDKMQFAYTYLQAFAMKHIQETPLKNELSGLGDAFNPIMIPRWMNRDIPSTMELDYIVTCPVLESLDKFVDSFFKIEEWTDMFDKVQPPVPCLVPMNVLDATQVEDEGGRETDENFMIRPRTDVIFCPEDLEPNDLM